MNRFGDFAALVIWDFHRPHRFIGNTWSASLPISLDEANRAGHIKLSDLVAMMAVGAGMTWGSALMRW
jgi:3-oxoacyl-[acyl-carrier-protein] synthase III